jgi:hypothetical protein
MNEGSSLTVKYIFSFIYKGWVCDILTVIMKYICSLPPFICPFVHTADMEMLVTTVTMLARHITAIPSPKTFNPINTTLHEQIH